MISVSKQVDYGLQLLITLAAQEDGIYLSLREFSGNRKISFLFLQKIVKKLREAGLVEAQKGAHGGYRLAHDPAYINLQQIIEAVEGYYAPVSCMKQGDCPVEPACSSKRIFSFVQHDIVTSMSKYSLKKMMNLSRR